jgi:hypothetical protein
MSRAEQELLCSNKMAQKLNMNMDDETTEIIIEEMYANDPKMRSSSVAKRSPGGAVATRLGRQR